MTPKRSPPQSLGFETGGLFLLAPPKGLEMGNLTTGMQELHEGPFGVIATAHAFCLAHRVEGQ